MGRDEGVKFPASEALALSLENVRRRFGRALVTMVSIILGIAFLSFLLTTGRIMSYAAGGSGVVIKFYQLWFAVIALLICSVGIVNSMLMSVTERYKEIGTMKCLGAMNKHILQIFLIEALLLGLLGGILGAFAGWGSATLWQTINPPPGVGGRMEVLIIAIKMWAEFNFTDPLMMLSNPLIGVVLSVLIALFSSLAPAYIAANLNPTEALRYEV